MESKWRLPKPDFEDKITFRPIIRVARTVPFGYTQSEDDPDVLLPIEKELEALEYAKKLLKEYSYREVAHWLSEETGRGITHEGLRKRVKLEYKRKRQASNARLLAERYKEAQKKAEELEAKLGARSYS